MLREYQITELVLHIQQNYEEFNIVWLPLLQAGSPYAEKIVFSTSVICIKLVLSEHQITELVLHLKKN